MIWACSFRLTNTACGGIYNVQVLYDGSRGVFFTLNITKLFLNLFLNLLFSVGQQRQYQQQQRADFVII